MSDTKNDADRPLSKVPFSTLLDMGEWLLGKGEYKKALEYFTTALTLKPGDKKCFIGRSKCYMKMGQIEKALKETEASLEDDKSYHEGLYQKAEALYDMGNFPLALMVYHRGHKTRPQMQEFAAGIQKAQDAIHSAISTIPSVKPKTKGDPSFFMTDEEKKTPQSLKSTNSEKVLKQCGGEFARDKKFLEDLMREKDFVRGATKHEEQLEDIIQSSLTLIDGCAEFLNQEKRLPPQERKSLHSQQKSRTPPEPAQFVLKSLNDINAELTSGNAEGSLKKAKQVLKTVQKWSEKEVPNKKEFLGSLHTCIGNALFELKDMDEALKHYQKDLELAKERKHAEAMSRALDNMGRTCVEKEDFALAIEFFEKNIPLVRDDLEKTCLFHNIGCCYVELNRHDEARKYGLRSVAAADKIADEKWQMYANVLVAVSELKRGHFESSVSHFEKAMTHARGQEDDFALNSLQKALDDAKQHIQS